MAKIDLSNETSYNIIQLHKGERERMCEKKQNLTGDYKVIVLIMGLITTMQYVISCQNYHTNIKQRVRVFVF